MAGLVGDGPVGCAAGVGVGDEAGAEAVRAVPTAVAGTWLRPIGGVDARPTDGRLHDVVDGPGGQSAGECPVALADGPEQRSVGDAGEVGPLPAGR